MRFRAILALGILAVLSCTALAAESYKVDVAHSSVGFRIRHLVGNVTGRFDQFEGSILLDSSDLTRSSVTLTIRAATIDTAEPKRDEHLRSADFFDVDRHPDMTFRSTRITRGSGDTYQVTGAFSMHGVTKEITVPVEYLGTALDPWGNEKAGFSATFKLNRKDWGIVWNKTLDAGGFLLGDEVTASIQLEAARESAPQKPSK